MVASPKLSPMASYYIRRLVQARKATFLEMAESNGLAETSLTEPEEILARLGLGEPERSMRINKLEILARAYQNLTEAKQKPEDLKVIELEIFSHLCFPNLPTLSTAQQFTQSLDALSNKNDKITAGKALEILQALLSYSAKYLGPKITSHYLLTTRPSSEWIECFNFKEDHSLTLNRLTSYMLSEQELEDIKTWVKMYILNCSDIIHDFHTMVNQDHLQLLSLSDRDFPSTNQ